MKKFLIAFPVIFCLILSVCLPFVSFADSSFQFEGASPDGVDISQLEFYGLHVFKNQNNFKDGDLYFYVNFIRGGGSKTTYSGYIQADQEDIKSCEESNGIYTILFSDYGNLIGQTWTSFSGFSEHNYTVRKIVVDTNLNTVEIFETVNASFVVFPMGGYLYHYSTNMFDAKNNSMPDVTVEFTPDLSGEVDRSVLSSSGSKSLLQELNMKVTNNSSFPVQYRMWIEKKNQVTSRVKDASINGDYKTFFETSYDDDPVFVYYSNSVVYDVIGERSSQEDFNVQDVTKYNKATDWHYLKAGEVEEVKFDFSMINMTENCTYVCKVWAYKCDYECASTRLYNPQSEGFPATPEFKQVDMTYFTEAYNSTFSMLQYSDIKYDPNKSSDKILPYDGSKGISSAKHYEYSYDAKVDKDTGETLIGHKDLYNDANSWINKKPPLYPSGSPGSSGGLTDYNITSFSGMFANVFGAVSMFMNYLPSSIMSIFIFGFSCVIVIAVIKAVK